MRTTYIRRRRHNVVDMLIAENSWLKITVQDGPSGGGKYGVRIYNSVYEVDDPDAGQDSSADIVDALIEGMRGGIEPIEIATTSDPNVFYIRYSKLGQQPRREASYDAYTTDEGGNISAREVVPEKYVVKTAENWDQNFTAMQEIRRGMGYVSESLRAYQDSHVVNAGQFRHYTRFLYSPTDYGQRDNYVNFYRVTTVVDGEEIHTGPIDILMTSDQYNDVGDDAIILAGTVPEADSFDNALYIRLPVRTSKFEVRNKGDNPLNVSFDAGQASFRLEKGQSFSDNRSNNVGFTLWAEGGETEVEIFNTIKTSQFIS